MGLIRRAMDPDPSPQWFQTGGSRPSNEAICCLFYHHKKSEMVPQGDATPTRMTHCCSRIRPKPSTRKILSRHPPGSLQRLGSASRRGPDLDRHWGTDSTFHVKNVGMKTAVFSSTISGLRVFSVEVNHSEDTSFRENKCHHSSYSYYYHYC